MDDIIPRIQTIRSHLLSVRFNFICEKDLQDGIERVLTDKGVPFTREFRFDAKDRVDFLIEGGIGLEVKIDKNLSQVTRQLFRYAQQPMVSGLLLVTSRIRLTSLPENMNGKPILSVWLAGSAL